MLSLYQTTSILKIPSIFSIFSFLYSISLLASNSCVLLICLFFFSFWTIKCPKNLWAHTSSWFFCYIRYFQGMNLIFIRYIFNFQNMNLIYHFMCQFSLLYILQVNLGFISNYLIIISLNIFYYSPVGLIS